MNPLFFFGSLRDRALLETVLDRPVDPATLRPAIAHDYAALALGHEAYPYLAERPGQQVKGVVLMELSGDDLSRLKYFEEGEYGLAPISAITEDGHVEAFYFCATERILGRARDVPWDFEAWVRDERAVAIEAAAEMMAYFGIVPVEDIDSIWPGIMIRARMRARAKAEQPVKSRLRQARAAADVEHLGIERPYTRYFAIEEHRLRHRRFDGGWSRDITRTAIVTGDAVTVLPYDPNRDRVLLIEQFRAPMLARGDACPWGIEVIAGRLDQETDAEPCARREALEEAGLHLGRLEQVAAYYSTPGFAAEHITAYVGEADLPALEGTFGEGSEDEDIRAFTVSLDEALAAAQSGEISNGPALLSLLWLQANRGRLAQAWATPAEKTA